MVVRKRLVVGVCNGDVMMACRVFFNSSIDVVGFTRFCSSEPSGFIRTLTGRSAS